MCLLFDDTRVGLAEGEVVGTDLRAGTIGLGGTGCARGGLGGTVGIGCAVLCG